MKYPGPFVPLDVNYARDRAIAAAGEAAELLYVRGLAYSKHTRSDGFIPDYDLDEVAKRLRKVPDRVAALVREGLWSVVEGGWLIRNWPRWNESSAEQQEKRDRDAERQRRRRAQMSESPDGVTADVQRDTASSPNGVTPLSNNTPTEVTTVRTTRDVVLTDEPPDDPTNALLIEHVNAYDEPPPLDAQRTVKQQIMRQVALGEPAERIRAGLARMREKRVAVSLLPQLIAECSPVARPSTTDQRVATGMALVEKYRAEESA